jgi:protein involved in polysaccharide export with SLBB domain
VKEFEKAGPIASKVNVDDGMASKSHTGPYRVVPGDILEFQMPAILRVISSDLSEWLRPVYGHRDIEPYLVRVSETGIITLPIIGEIPVAGKTLAEIESSVIDAYFPKYVVNPPMVVCEVKKYQSENERVFTVVGLVNHPATFPYPPDVQYNLMEALAFAGGLDMTADPHYLKIYRQDASGKVIYATFGVDKKSLVDAYGVRIKPGDVIYVDHTLRTRVNKFLSDIFRVTVGADTRYTSYR